MSPIRRIFDLKVKGQGQTVIMMVRETLSHHYTATYQISLTSLKLSATFWSGGLTLFWGTRILKIKFCLCNNLCKRYLVEFLFYVCTFKAYFYLIGI
jgi:hypothetical protein